MEEDRNLQDRQEFCDDFRLAVYELLQFIGNERGDSRHRIRPDDREWRLQRAKTIEKLNELREKLDQTCVAANYGKGVGIGAKVLGEITSMVAALMELGESPSAQSLMKIGKVVSHSGSLLEGASHTVESVVSSKYLSEIQEVLRRDYELSKPLQEWLAFSRNMDVNVRKIFGYDLNFAIQNNVMKVFSEFTMLYSQCRNFQRTIDLMRRGDCSMDMNIGTTVPIERLLRFSSQLEMYPELHDGIHEICFVLMNSATAIQVAMEGVRVYRNLFGEEDLNSRTVENSQSPHDRVAEGSLKLRTERDYNLEPPSVREVSTFCAFQTIDIAVNVVHLLTVITTIKDGKSKYSHALRQITNLLAMELRSMEALRF